MYTEKELEKLINDVENEFTSHLAKAEENFLAKSETSPAVESLAKAEGGEKKPEPKEKEDGKEEPPKQEAKPEGEAPAPAAEAKPEGEVPPAEGKPAEGQPAQEGHDYDDEDMEHMRKMYSSMSKAELKAHHDCIAKCGGISPSAPAGAAGPLSPDSGSQPEVQKSEDGLIKPCQPSGSPGAKTPASAANGEKINVGLHKAEPTRESGGKIESSPVPKSSPGAKSPASKVEGVQMEKSETSPEVELLKNEVAAEKAKTESLQKNLDAVSAFLTKLVEKKVAPAGKAITSLDVIAKSEGSQESKELSKVEIDSALSRKSQDPKLEKSDRDAINDYYLGGKNVEKIRHLLK